MVCCAMWTNFLRRILLLTCSPFAHRSLTFSTVNGHPHFIFRYTSVITVANFQKWLKKSIISKDDWKIPSSLELYNFSDHSPLFSRFCLSIETISQPSIGFHSFISSIGISTLFVPTIGIILVNLNNDLILEKEKYHHHFSTLGSELISTQISTEKMKIRWKDYKYLKYTFITSSFHLRFGWNEKKVDFFIHYWLILNCYSEDKRREKEEKRRKPTRMERSLSQKKRNNPPLTGSPSITPIYLYFSY